MSAVGLPPLPSSYLLEGDRRRGWIALRKEAAAALQRVGFGLDGDGATRPAAERGRGVLLELALDDVGGRACGALVREHRRGGLPARLGFAGFGDPARPFFELLVSEGLRGRGISTPRVLAARARVRSDAPLRMQKGYDLAIATERVVGAVDLFEALRTARGQRRQALTRGAGRFVAQLFEAGLDHSDLHPKNLLVTEGAGEPLFHVVDLDKAKLCEPGELSMARQRDQLARLLRFCLRRRAAIDFSAADALRFLVAHLGDRPWRPLFSTLAKRATRRIAWSRRDA